MNPFVRDSLRPAFSGKKILLGVSGSIAAFKACDLVRLLRDCGARVRVVLTDSAQKFVTPLTLETLAGERAYYSVFDGVHGTHHIETARWANLALIAPATANTIAKLAHGLADDLLSTELLAFTGPVLIAPAMNPAMYAHPALQANVAALKSRGVLFIGPERGLTSCGEEGLGRMTEPDAIVETVAMSFAPNPRPQRKLLLTLGPTRSPIDPVRYITNRSSGLMGAAIAWVARQRGYLVTAICGPTQAPLPSDISIIRVETATEMADATLKLWPSHDVFAGAAAVLDWDVREPRIQKLKKTDGSPSIEFSQNPDILALIAQRKSREQFVLGFAAETERVVEQARQKLILKKCDAIFANDVAALDLGFESTENAGWWISSRETIEIPRGAKHEVAATLLTYIDRGINHRNDSSVTTH